jgi:hypothetical protein
MATRTLKTKYETLDGSVSRNRSILCHAKNVKEIYYQYEDEIEAPASDVTVDVPIAATPAVPVTTVSTHSFASLLDQASRIDVRVMRTPPFCTFPKTELLPTCRIPIMMVQKHDYPSFVVNIDVLHWQKKRKR